MLGPHQVRILPWDWNTATPPLHALPSTLFWISCLLACPTTFECVDFGWMLLKMMRANAFMYAWMYLSIWSYCFCFLGDPYWYRGKNSMFKGRGRSMFKQTWMSVLAHPWTTWTAPDSTLDTAELLVFPATCFPRLLRRNILKMMSHAIYISTMQVTII